MTATRSRYCSAVLVAIAILAGCGGETTTPGVQPEIVNTPDHFSYQVTNVRNYSATQSYTWENSGTQATVNQASSFGSGSATLVIVDAMGTQIYSRSLADNGTFTTVAGTAGTWTIRIVYSSANATLNFRADKTT